MKFAKLNLSHKARLEHIYQDIKFPDAIDWWTGHYAQNEMDVAVSNARHLDPARQAIEDEVWRRIVPVGGHVLDLACGRGFFSRRLLNVLDGKARITGFDLSEAILRVALSEQEGIPFVLGNAERLPFSESVFDAILVVSAFEHIKNPRPVIREICRVLKSQGYLYICLHKPFVDPFVLPGVAMGSLRLIKRLFQQAISKDKACIGYKGTMRELRRNMHAWLSQTGFEWMESRALLHQMDWIFYKKAIPWAVPALIRLGQRLNRLPFRYYKDLEYWLLQKP